MLVAAPLNGVELRLFEERHVDALYALVDRNRDYLRRWLPWVDMTRGPGEIRVFIKEGLRTLADNGAFNAGIWINGTLAGVIGFHRIDWADRTTALGYWLSEEQEGRGVMTCACRQMIEYAFGELGLHRVEIHCAVNNTRSRAIPERLGFSAEGVLREAEWLYDRFMDHVVYAMLASEWPRLRDRQSPR